MFSRQQEEGRMLQVEDTNMSLFYRRRLQRLVQTGWSQTAVGWENLKSKLLIIYKCVLKLIFWWCLELRFKVSETKISTVTRSTIAEEKIHAGKIGHEASGPETNGKQLECSKYKTQPDCHFDNNTWHLRKERLIGHMRSRRRWCGRKCILQSHQADLQQTCFPNARTFDSKNITNHVLAQTQTCPLILRRVNGRVLCCGFQV